jgi:MoxR-like ATPase
MSSSVTVIASNNTSMSNASAAIASGSTSSLYTCTPRQIKKHIERCMQANIVPMVRSSPGMGKSAIIKKIGEEWNLKVIDHRASTSAPEDFTGLPRFNEDGTAQFHPFADLFPIEGTPLPEGKDGWLIFLDEFNSAPKSVEAASYKLVLDFMTGQKKLHNRVRIICAGNLETDKAIVNSQSTAMGSRMVHLQMILDLEEYQEDVLYKQNYDPRVTAYLTYRPNELMNFDPDSEERTFNCPRTWEFVNRLLATIDGPLQDDDAVLFAGTISSGSAVNFIQFTRVFQSMVSVEDIARDPKGVAVPSDSATRYAVTCHMMDKVTKDNFEALATYIERFDMTFKILFFRSINVRNPELKTHPTFGKAMVSLSKYLHDY